MDRNIDFEENLPYQEGTISEMYERPDKSYVQEPTESKDLIDTTKLIQKFLPKQRDIEKSWTLSKEKSWKVPICHSQSKKFKLHIIQVLILKTYTYI